MHANIPVDHWLSTSTASSDCRDIEPTCYARKYDTVAQGQHLKSIFRKYNTHPISAVFGVESLLVCEGHSAWHLKCVEQVTSLHTSEWRRKYLPGLYMRAGLACGEQLQITRIQASMGSKSPTNGDIFLSLRNKQRQQH